MQSTCLKCGIPTDVADEYSGQPGLCAHCGEAVKVLPDGGVVPKRGRSFRLDWSGRSLRSSLILIMLIVGCEAINSLFSLFLPAVQAARGSPADTMH